MFARGSDRLVRVAMPAFTQSLIYAMRDLVRHGATTTA